MHADKLLNETWPIICIESTKLTFWDQDRKSIFHYSEVNFVQKLRCTFWKWCSKSLLPMLPEECMWIATSDRWHIFKVVGDNHSCWTVHTAIVIQFLQWPEYPPTTKGYFCFWDFLSVRGCDQHSYMIYLQKMVRILDWNVLIDSPCSTSIFHAQLFNFDFSLKLESIYVKFLKTTWIVMKLLVYVNFFVFRIVKHIQISKNSENLISQISEISENCENQLTN